MEREMIERLTIDSAAGELNDDTSSLLQAYLVEHPEAKQWSKEILTIYNKTDLVIKAKTKEATATSHMTNLKKPHILSKADWQPILKWAAVVILAAMVGIGLGRWSKETKIYTKLPYEEMRHELMLKWPAVDFRDDVTGFWQEKVVAFLKPRTYPERKPYMKRDSWWDRYYRFTEKYHE